MHSLMGYNNIWLQQVAKYRRGCQAVKLCNALQILTGVTPKVSMAG
jgi:hypothetical protein